MATLGTTVISTVTLVTDTLQDNQAGVTSWSLARVDTVVTCTIIFNHWRFSRGFLGKKWWPVSIARTNSFLPPLYFV